MSRFALALLGVAVGSTLLRPMPARAVVLETNLAQWQADAGTAGVETSDFGVAVGGILGAVTLADGTTLTLGSDVSVLGIGDGWSTWCCGYAGQVLFSGGASSIDFTVSPVAAFGMFIEPQFAFFTYDVTLSLSDGQTLSEALSGYSSAAFFGWVGADVTGFSISTDGVVPSGFAVGDFYSEPLTAPEPGPLTIIAGVLLGGGAARWRCRVRRREPRSGAP